MNTYFQFVEIPISRIKPKGWLYEFLDRQRKNLTGHMEQAGYPFNTRGWKAEKIDDKRACQDWWPYEQTGYWIDGLIRCGLLLDDGELIDKARKQLDYVIKNPDKNGYLGPGFMKDPADNNRWPHAVLFRSYMALYSATPDMSIVNALRAHYLSNTGKHSEARNICNTEIMLWLYNKTGDKKLLNLALNEYRTFNSTHEKQDFSLTSMESDITAWTHGVTYNEIAKLGAVFYAYTGNKRYLKATENAYKKIDRDHMLVDGVNSSTEFLLGKEPLNSHETCDIADYTWSIGYLLLATGNREYADKIERACFNALPGAIAKDFSAVQYFSCPNQIIADDQSNHNMVFKGKSTMAYRGYLFPQCCTGEVNRIMPNYISRMWLESKDGGIVAALYGPSEAKYSIGKDKKEVQII
jgi:DUF1680 family protein